MGRRRWRFITIAAFLLFITKDTFCQDDDSFFYNPIERNYAQVQPPLYPSNRPATYFENGDNYRFVSQGIVNSPQSQHFGDAQVRLPSPNYNQNPAPFQLGPVGRSQSGTPYYQNQPNYVPQKQRYRPALPHNYHLIQASPSTRRPDSSQIHSVAYQHDPSRPEAFLGQVTINNPDTDYLQNNRFENIQITGNGLKGNLRNNHEQHDDDIVNNNQDLYNHHKVTTYNPSNYFNSQRVVNKPNPSRFPSYNPPSNVDLQVDYVKQKYSSNQGDKAKQNTPKDINSKEDKVIHDLEPLLEEDISDFSGFKELMKNSKPSDDVEIVKSNNSEEYKHDNNPSASFMNADKIPKVESLTHKNITSTENVTSRVHDDHRTAAESLDKGNNMDNTNENNNDDSSTEEIEEVTEYVEYYDDVDPSDEYKPPQKSSTEQPNEYDDYDSTEEFDSEQPHHENHEEKNNFDVLLMKNNNNTVQDDNFKQFVDTAIIDHTEQIEFEDSTETTVEIPTKQSDISSVETPSILGQEVVSVVTTKSVVNGTISIPDYEHTPSSIKTSTIQANTLTSARNKEETSTSSKNLVTTENWVVVASVQTSRSVSGARFLPFPAVAQEEKKQVLTEDGDSNEDLPPTKPTNSEINDSKDLIDQPTTVQSTENINDKLDSIQSELSSAVLSGSLDSDKNIEIITESTAGTNSNVTSTTATSLNLFTLKSTEMSHTTERSAPEPLPVLIKKFTPKISTTTQKPKKKLVTVMDELSPGLLPPGYRPRVSYKDKRTTTTSTTTSTTANPTPLLSENDLINATQGRSSGISSKNKVIITDSKAPVFPKSTKSKDVKKEEDILKKFQQEDVSLFLPPGFKPLPENKDEKIDILEKVKKVDISAFLPKNYSSTTTAAPGLGKKILASADPIDISAFLPPDFKLNDTKEIAGDIIQLKPADILSLLPPGFKLNESEAVDSVSTSTTTRAPPSGSIKLVFPSRPGSKPVRKNTTAKPANGSGPAPATPKIQKGWPTRASTEFTGWPSPSTTPFSIEKLLEAQRNATATSPSSDISTEAVTRRTTTTTTTTLAPPPPTTPGICNHECDIAATIKIVAGVKWVPELLDHNTDEWQKLAKDVKDELNSVYSRSELLSKWYKGIRIESFSKGSVLVDYFIELNDIDEKINTLDLKEMFHQSLNEARPGSYVKTINNDEEPESKFDPNVMLGDQPQEDRNSDEKVEKTIDLSSGKLEIGKFVMDPAYTEFIVLPKREEPKMIMPEEESFLPQWGIAVIVIALASLLFVIIFGVTVLVNRQKNAKAKQPIPLSEDMLRELDKSHMGGFEDIHHLKERDLPYHTSGKRMSNAFIEQLAYPNPGDSWRSEWTPQLHKYMQHYTPDSGRGSQIYGTAGNLYGYSGSQMYGQTGGGGGGGGGGSLYGYSGEHHPRHYARRRSYDTNF